MRRLTAVAVVIALILVSGGVVDAAPAAGADPTTWACDSGHLGLGKDTVQLAPTDIGDKAPNGGPITRTPDSRGKYVPVIMVHGWTSTSTHTSARKGAFSHLMDLDSPGNEAVTDTRSLIGNLQGLPGAAVFTFDYHDYSARWVDDTHLGLALGAVIDCLYRASGEKVIVVAHSMGGLIARYAAAQPGLNGAKDRSGEISSVVTFGTPETGSIAAMLAAGVIDMVADDVGPMAVVRSILAACGRQSSKDIVTGTLCDRLPPPIRAFASDAGVALRYGSPQLAALKPFPPGIFVDALAGGASFEVPSGGWFGLPWDTKPVNVGDLIVAAGSALHSAALTKQASCAYQLNAVRGATDQIGLLIKQVAKPDVAQQPLAAFTGACMHTDLMRNIFLTSEATGEVHDDIAGRQPVTGTELLHAPVPAACQHKAGTLVNGLLPGIPKGQGGMEVAWLYDRAHASNFLALGDLTGDGYGDAAAVLSCDAGGVPWPDLVALYTQGPKLLGFVSLNEITVPGVEPGGTAPVNAIKYVDGAIDATWSSEQDGDPECCATLDYEATLKWNSTRVVATDVRGYNELPTATGFVSAMNSHDTAKAKGFAADGVAERAAQIATALPGAFADSLGCYGQNADLPGPVAALIDPGAGPHDQDTSRVCYLGVEGGYVVLGLLRSGYRQWKVQWIEQV